MFGTDRKLRQSFKKIKLDMVALEMKMVSDNAELRKYVSNVEKMLNSRIDMILEILNEKAGIKATKDLKKTAKSEKKIKTQNKQKNVKKSTKREKVSESKK